MNIADSRVCLLKLSRLRLAVGWRPSLRTGAGRLLTNGVSL